MKNLFIGIAKMFQKIAIAAAFLVIGCFLILSLAFLFSIVGSITGAAVAGVLGIILIILACLAIIVIGGVSILTLLFVGLGLSEALLVLFGITMKVGKKDGDEMGFEFKNFWFPKKTDPGTE